MKQNDDQPGPRRIDPAAAAHQSPRSGAPLPSGPLAGFTAALVAVLAIALATFFSLQNRKQAGDLVMDTMEVMEQVRAVLSGLREGQTGQRGFLITGSEEYLAPYAGAKAALPGRIEALKKKVADNPRQVQRAAEIGAHAAERLDEWERSIALRRAGDQAGAYALVNTGLGLAVFEQVRVLGEAMLDEEQRLLANREREWIDAITLSSAIVWGGSLLLLILIVAAAGMASREYRSRRIETWIRAGHAGLAERLQGGQRLEGLGKNVLDYLAGYLGAQVGAIYISEAAGYRRFAAYALPAGAGADAVVDGQGLVGQAAAARRLVRVTDAPPGYLSVTSGTGAARPAALLLAPAVVDGIVHAVVELGFFRPLHAEDEELLARVSELLAMAIRASSDRVRLEALLEQTQRQAEALQVQQEELRVNNEELEEQGRALKESQAQLETQQVELEQTNTQLEAQAQLLEAQRDTLERSEAVLAGKAHELERSNQYKSEFLANMSHELRTPLNSTLILAKLLADNKEGNLTAEQVKFAQTISGAGNDLLALIDDILDLSKIEAGKMKLSCAPVQVKSAAESIVKSLQPIAGQKNLALTLEVDASAPARIETDPQRLAQILKNLLSNALKFTERGEVALRVASTGAQTISFAVTDTGIGIPAEQQQVIFEAFRQADGSTHRKYGGTGLGLSISRDLARLLGGHVSVESAPGQGSTFTLTLPVAYTAPAEAAPAPAAPAPAPAAPAVHSALARDGAPPPRVLASLLIPDDRDTLGGGKRVILVIEDDLRFAEILRDLAHEMGFQCIVTNLAEDGLAAAEQYRPSAVVLDMNLPDHSGLLVLDQLKRNPATRHIPVHVVSVADYSQEALERGAIGYALKPVRRDDLVDAFKRLEAKFTQSMRRVLVVEDDERQREAIQKLLAGGDTEIVTVPTASDALSKLKSATYDCVVMDLNLPDMSGFDLLRLMAEEDAISFPPVIVYTGRSLTPGEGQMLRRFSKSIIIKDARSPERLVDEVTLFLHQMESSLPAERQAMLRMARDREASFEGRRILLVEDDVRNVFALSRVLEPKGAKVEIARNGLEALAALGKSAAPGQGIDLVLMDIMMPEMDGFTAMREIRKKPEWKKLPIIALTAKAMKDDQEKCIAAGANDYIAKPLDVERLLSLLRVWLPR